MNKLRRNTTAPNGSFMKQVARNLTDVSDGFLLNSRYLIPGEAGQALMDRDTKYTEEFRDNLDREGVKPVRCPARAPNCKDYVSHCTSFVRFGMTSAMSRRCANFRPWALTGGSSPGGSYKHSFLSL